MKSCLLLLTLCGVALGALAQQPLKSATAEELAEKLAPPVATTRSLRNIVPVARNIDLVVQFDFNSAHLQDASKPLLAHLAQAMASERIKAISFRIEGHTDAVGKPGYNQQLSERRAVAVTEFLAQQGVERERLSAEGKGASELLLPDKPDAMENRRVRITTLN